MNEDDTSKIKKIPSPGSNFFFQELLGEFSGFWVPTSSNYFKNWDSFTAMYMTATLTLRCHLQYWTTGNLLISASLQVYLQGGVSRTRRRSGKWFKNWSYTNNLVTFNILKLHKELLYIMTNIRLNVIYALLASAISRHSFQSILCLVTFYSAIAQNEILSTTTDGVNILENTNTNLVSYWTFLIFELYPMLIWYQYIASRLHL